MIPLSFIHASNVFCGFPFVFLDKKVLNVNVFKVYNCFL